MFIRPKSGPHSMCAQCLRCCTQGEGTHLNVQSRMCKTLKNQVDFVQAGTGEQLKQGQISYDILMD